MALQAFYGITITVPTAPAALLPLLQAINPTLNQLLQNAANVQAQADQTNGSNYVLLGDNTVSASSQQCAVKLSPGQAQYLYREAMSIPLGAIWVVATGSGSLLNVLIVIE